MSKQRAEVKKLELTPKQRTLLHVVSGYRHVTAVDVAELLNLSHHATIHARLEKLRSLGYVERQYDSSYRLTHKRATYHVTKKAIPILRDMGVYSSGMLKLLYNDATASERFISHSLSVLSICIAIHRLHGGRKHAAPRSVYHDERFDRFLPRPRPDIFMELSDGTRGYIDYYEDGVLLGIHGRVLRRYCRYMHSYDWEEPHGTVFPSVYMVCQSTTLEKRLMRYVKHVLYDETEYDLTVYVTTIDRLQRASTPEEIGWRAVRLDEWDADDE